MMAERLATLLETIKEETRASGRKDEVQLMAVSKTHPLEAVLEAVACGQLLFGENRVQEIESKFPPTRDTYQLHMIGHLQSNKVKKVVPLVDAIDSIDSLRLARLVSRHALALDKVMPVLLEVNTSGEAAKVGFTSEKSYYESLDEAHNLPGIAIKGLMTIGPLSDNEKEVRQAFAQLRKISEESKVRYPELCFDTLSMGMSQDFLWAIKEGSTMVRIGTTIFGRRDYQ